MQVYHIGKLWASIIAAVVVGGFLQCADIISVVHRQPDYSAAQRNTVIVDTPGGQSTGVVIKRAGFTYAWTAYHAISGEGPTVTVKQFSHSASQKTGPIVFSAAVIWTDSKHDLALLWVAAPDNFFTGVTFASAHPAPVGTEVFHVGNWLGEDFDGSVSVGIISQIGVSRIDPAMWPWELTDQTTATIASGSSGGGLFNKQGEVVGIIVGGPHKGDFGFAHFIPVRVIASDPSIRWAVW